MKIYYLNDEQKEMTVKILDATYDPAMGTGITYYTLQSCEGRVFDVVVPANSSLYVKKWVSMVMISYIDLAGLPQSEREPLGGNHA